MDLTMVDVVGRAHDRRDFFSGQISATFQSYFRPSFQFSKWKLLSDSISQMGAKNCFALIILCIIDAKEVHTFRFPTRIFELASIFCLDFKQKNAWSSEKKLIFKNH